MRISRFVGLTILSVSVLDAQETCDESIRYLEGLNADRTAESVGQEIARIEETSRRESGACRGRVLLQITDAYSRIGQEDRLGRELETKYALLGLSSRSIPVETEVDLLRHLKEGAPVSAGGRSTRRRFANHWVAAWVRVKRETIPNFNFEDLPFMNVQPPHGGATAAGMSPENIKDPSQRREYEAMLRANAAKISLSNTQVFLRRETPAFVAQFEHFFLSSFSATDVGEIRELLSPLGGDQEASRIIALVAQQGTADHSIRQE